MRFSVGAEDAEDIIADLQQALNAAMTPEEVTIEDLWDKYDVNKMGFLEKEDLAKFVIDLLMTKGHLKSDADFNRAKFDEVFATLSNENHVISKESALKYCELMIALGK